MPLNSYSTGGRIENGKLELDDRQAFSTAMWRMNPGPVVVQIERDEAKRSSAANRYLWGVIYREIEEYTGQSKEQIHDEMCARFTSETIAYVNPSTGQMVEMVVVRRTSGMRVSRFHKFVSDVKLFASEFFGLTFEDAPEEFYKERESALARDAKKDTVA